MNVAVVGAGAVGLGLSSCVADRCNPLHLVVRRTEAEKTIARDGIHRTGLFGDRHIEPRRLNVTSRIDDLARLALDYLLVCTKTVETPALAQSLASLWETFPTPPQIVLCHNGWGSAQRFVRWLPAQHVFNARIITGFRRDAENVVDITVHAQPIAVGSLFGASTDVLQPLCRAIAAGGIPCETTERIDRDLFAKLLYNCLLNPLGALARVPYGVLGERAETRAIMESLAHEIFRVLDASGRRTHWNTASQYLETFYAQLLPPTAEHESSMLQDLRAGRPTEIDALCGAVVALAREVGVDVPVNASLLALIRAAEERGASA